MLGAPTAVKWPKDFWWWGPSRKTLWDRPSRVETEGHWNLPLIRADETRASINSFDCLFPVSKRREMQMRKEAIICLQQLFSFVGVCIIKKRQYRNLRSWRVALWIFYLHIFLNLKMRPFWNETYLTQPKLCSYQTNVFLFPRHLQIFGK